MKEPSAATIIMLPGTPQTKLRPRFSKRKGKTRTYDEQTSEKQTVKWQLKARMRDRSPLEGALWVKMTFVFKRPKSRERLKEQWHTVKPDLDNLIKWIGDVGNGTLWHDDKQIARIEATKIYGEEPSTIIEVGKLTDERD